ncbi:hypothetical protein E4U21_007816 [Claviceps maximensis]|nr:hypothetical protein E4U21_007816 [Claviceps maximensis]
MPPRLVIPQSIPRCPWSRPLPHSCRIIRAFHASPASASASASAGASAGAAETARKNHYERLNIRHDASAGEIKKSFYSLSKTHHPDVNPSDPQASQTFSLLSESYTILSDPTTRAKYDRDILRLHQKQQHHHHPHHGASYHSSHPAGGRAPSGLSRRRGTFRGPPPSFYKNGAWGAQTERRRRAEAEAAAAAAAAAHEGSARTSSAAGQDRTRHHARRNDAGSPDGPFAHAYAYTHAQYGGMGPGSDPFNFSSSGGGGADFVPPHFDRESHTRTHRRQDERRRDRGRGKRALGDDDVEFEPQTSLAGHFLIVAGILGATFMAPLVYLQVTRLGRKEKE